MSAVSCSAEWCNHVMQVRCRACRREQYGPSVWHVSHGGECAWCGTPGKIIEKVAGRPLTTSGTLTPLGQQRVDTVEVTKAARALRSGAEPEQVVASLCLHVGVYLPSQRMRGYAEGYTEAECTWFAATRGLVNAAQAPERRRRRWGR